MPNQRSLIQIGVLLALLLTVSALSAQGTLDPKAEANFGELSLEAGFTPDPYIVTLTSGGEVNASRVGAGCSGYVTREPDFRYNWSGASNVLRFFFTGSSDTTLIISDPAGRFVCNDDTDGFNPLVEFLNPMAGAYTIWVGSYAANDYVPGYLMVSEQNSLPTLLITTLFSTTAQGSNNSVVVQPTPTQPPIVNEGKGGLTPQDVFQNQNNQGSQNNQAADLSAVQFYSNLDQTHTTDDVNYPQTPPVGGMHFPVWQNCGVYNSPVFDELAVHALEHGAVWLTYDPAVVSSSDIQVLGQIARQGTHRLVSPYPGQPAPVIATAWGAQLYLNSASDPRVALFIAQFEQQGPEPGATCSGGESRTASEF